MINHVWSVVCERILVDPETASPSYIGALSSAPIQSVNQKTGQIQIKPFTISTKIHKDGTNVEYFSIRLSLVAEGDSKSRQVISEKSEKLKSGTVFVEMNVTLDRFVIDKEGNYRLLVDLKVGDATRWKNVSSIPFSVKTKKTLKAIPIKSE
ncbi:hypothetical protein [Desulfogranum marinum]|uniref:hypothetical protein n=1 Tax=Desulfogranum marinum TaxID=453220 RepID=UPI001965B4FB|nr:hypothetical protein [Desulfogranum marinum]MBM9512879.1 hypothetical protein [Desulfogranum marinum]